MAVYYIISKGRDGNRKVLAPTLNTEEFVRDHNDFYMTSTLDGRYRLHARNATTADEFLPFDVRCPRCTKEMKCIGGPRSLYELGLYECRSCRKSR